MSGEETEFRIQESQVLKTWHTSYTMGFIKEKKKRFQRLKGLRYYEISVQN